MDYHITFDDGSSAYLAHHGVLGMKWGVRNAETRAKYASAGFRGRRAMDRAARAQYKKEFAGARDIYRTEKKSAKNRSAVRDARQKYNKAIFDAQYKRDVTSRGVTEDQYSRKQHMLDSIISGEHHANKVGKIIGKGKAKDSKGAEKRMMKQQVAISVGASLAGLGALYAADAFRKHATPEQKQKVNRALTKAMAITDPGVHRLMVWRGKQAVQFMNTPGERQRRKVERRMKRQGTYYTNGLGLPA